MTFSDVRVSFISGVEIDNSFDAIINPFGETFPEEDWSARRTYGRILNYVNEGGLFVNVAGFPFFYYWNHVTGEARPTGKIRGFLNATTGSVVNVITFDDTPLFNDFGILLDISSPRQVAIYQEQVDKRYVGDLMNLRLNSVIEFRAILAGNPNVTPLVRAEEFEVYPLALVKRGYGHLLISGLELHEEQAPLVAHATRNWLLTAGGLLPLQTT